MTGTVQLHRVLRAPPSRIYRAFCYLGWQESLTLLAHVVEPEIPDGA